MGNGKVQCLICGAVLETKYPNDFVGCGCKNYTFASGNGSDFRYGGLNKSKVKVLKDPRLDFLKR